jgi:microcin C transport system substrate-binding protein
VMANPEIDRLITLYDKEEDIEEMKRLAFKLQELIHEEASFSPGFNLTFIRNGAWRWIGFPPEGNVKIASDIFEFSLTWIDEDLKKETKAAMESGKTFPPAIRIFDKYKPRP